MIKHLIVSDVDGTLLPYGQKELPPRIFDLIREALARNYMFAAASGRDYSSLKRLFAPVADDIYFITTNGGQLIYRDELLEKSEMPPAIVAELVDDIEAQGLSALVSTLEGSLVRSDNPAFGRFIAGFGNHVRLVDDFASVSETIVKAAAYRAEGVDEVHPYFRERWHEWFRVATAGPNWIDFNMTDKGRALASLAARLGVPAEAVWAFGDQQNDLAMLDFAGRAYLMSHAAPAFRREKYTLADDVVTTLEQLLAEA